DLLPHRIGLRRGRFTSYRSRPQYHWRSRRAADFRMLRRFPDAGPVFMKILALTASLSLALSAAAAEKEPDAVTAMTPDVVKEYNWVRPDADYERRVAMVPMRDGVKL